MGSENNIKYNLLEEDIKSLECYDDILLIFSDLHLCLSKGISDISAVNIKEMAKNRLNHEELSLVETGVNIILRSESVEYMQFIIDCIIAERLKRNSGIKDITRMNLIKQMLLIIKCGNVFDFISFVNKLSTERVHQDISSKHCTIENLTKLKK